jgi:LacI family repressor for deo operon, udp, cdd, tsx, nupC, and nupG
MAATIKDVARAAGVSTATVSRSLSRPESVAEKTRLAVLDAMRATGYRLNHAARALRAQRTGAIVVLVPDLGNPFFSQIIAGVEATISGAEMSVLIADTSQPEKKPGLLMEYLHENRADGIICFDGALPHALLKQSEESSAFPPIVFACEWTPDGGYRSVRVDNETGAMLAVRKLAQLGHRRIGHIKGPVGNVLTAARLDGALQAASECGVEMREEWIFDGDFTMPAGAQAAITWLGLADKPTAIFCASDLMAFGFISELARNGVRVPGDVSVIGFDDIEISRHFIPPLTTIRQPRTELGVTAAQFLLDAIAGRGHAGAGPVVLGVELVERESTAPVKSAQ